uniref:Ig-like domain-containing protein n=1 Tax=Suricata suricatta TaxID=37032 RepID=A0A673TVI4_SURSU
MGNDPRAGGPGDSRVQGWGLGSREPISFRTILTTSFYNHSWTQNQGSAWLDELQTHGWNSKTGSPFKRNLAPCLPIPLTSLFASSLLASTHLISYFSLSISCDSHYLFPDPFLVQVVKGCVLHVGEASKGFLRIAYQGSDLVSFQNTSWWPSPKGGNRAQEVCKLLNQYYVVNVRIEAHVNEVCPRFLLGLLDAGKADLQRQVRPEAWLSGGPSPGPGHLLLVCHVSGFYPKPVWVMWMRGEQEQPDSQRGDVLPHADGTWYHQVSLDVEAREAAGLSCRVRHSSLGGQDMVLYWGEEGLCKVHVFLIFVSLARSLSCTDYVLNKNVC